jgi:hypothetical protein
MVFFEKTGRFFLALVFLTTVGSAETPRPAEGLMPPAALRVEASRAENIPGYGPNAFGVYPVRIRWQKSALDSASSGYLVYRSTSPDAEFRQITAAPIPATVESGGFLTFIDENPAAVPGKPYYYRVSGSDGLDSSPCMGYGALNHEQYMLEYNKTAKSSHRKMTYMNKAAALSKLGAETRDGVVSGSLSYNARIAGLGARITMRYEHYADIYIDDNISLGPYFTLTGNINTTATLSQNGHMNGTVTAAGMYPGKVFYDNIEIKRGAAAAGTYGIEPEGFPRAEVSWTLGNR